MDNLSQEACSACRADSPMVSAEESAELIRQLPEWQLIEHDSVNQLTRSFKFRNFAQALAFTNRVGEAAEAEKHHPALVTEWDRCASPGGRTRFAGCIGTTSSWRRRPINSTKLR